MNLEELKEKATDKIEKYDQLMVMYKHPSVQYAFSLAKNMNLDLLNDLDNLEYNRKQLIQVPQMVIDFIGDVEPEILDGHHNEYDVLQECLTFVFDETRGYPYNDDLFCWISDNFEKFAKAVLEGCEVIKELQYYVIFQENEFGNRFVLSKQTGFAPSLSRRKKNTRLGDSCKFTEKEIMDINKLYWLFAVPVEGDKDGLCE